MSVSRILLLSIALSLLLAGCSSSKDKNASSASGSPATGPVASGSGAEPKPLEPETGKVDPEKRDLGKKPPINVPPPPDPIIFEVPKTGKGGWTITTVNGKDLAQRVGKAMATLKGTTARTLTTLTTPYGNGQIQTDIKIQDGETYSIQFPVLNKMPEQAETLADGTNKAYRNTSGRIDTKKPVHAKGPDAEIPPSQIARVWPREFPRLAYRGIVEGKDVWVPLINELNSPRSGFKTEISERTMDYKGQATRSYRLIATRTPAASKKLGPCEVEMVFDGRHYLPVTIRVNETVPKEGEFKIYWITHWLFKREFPNEDFKL